MTSFVRNALLGAAGLVLVSLPAHAASSTFGQDTPLLDSTAAKSIQLAQRAENPGGAGVRNENPGGAGVKKATKTKKAKKPKKKKKKNMKK